MARVLLIQAAVHNEHIECSPPLGLMSIASYARRYGRHEVFLHDMRPPKATLHDAVSFFDAVRPDYVGISAQSPDAPVMHQLVETIRSRAPQVRIICGGVHATAYWQDIMAERPAIDFIVAGEGEVVFNELVETLEQGRDPGGLSGVASRGTNGGVRFRPRDPLKDLDALPHPAWDLVDAGIYAALPRIGLIYKARRYMIIETARGCPFHCAWCHKTMGSTHRMHSPEYVIEQMERLVKDHGIGEIVIIDDLFNLDTDRVEQIFSGVIARKLGAAICIPNGIRADRMPDRTLELMRKAGVYRVMFAVETASARLQKLMGKDLHFEKVERAIRKADELGMLVHGNFIIGLPTETAEEVEQTIDYATRSLLDTVGIYRAIPFKGSQLYRIARQEGIAVPEGEATLSFWDPHVNLSRASTEFLNRMKKYAYRRFYSRPGRIVRLIRKLPHRASMIPFLFGFFLRKALRDD